MRYRLLTCVLIGLNALCWTSCASTKQISRQTETRENTSYTNVTNERDSVVIAERDTLKEVTMVTVQLNETGDTVKVSTVTDRTRESGSRFKVQGSKVELRTEIVRDTVYIEHRDTVLVSSSRFQGSSSLNPHPSALNYLKWIFALVCAVVVLVVVIRFGRRGLL